jgi:hypothetical protein
VASLHVEGGIVVGAALVCVMMCWTGWALIRHVPARCLCFGGTRSAPLSARTLARLLVLLGAEAVLCTYVVALRTPLPARTVTSLVLLCVAGGLVVSLTAAFLRVADVIDLLRKCRRCGNPSQI